MDDHRKAGDSRIPPGQHLRTRNCAWAGVSVQEILRHVSLRPDAKAVLVHADPDYTTNLTLEDLGAPDALRAIAANGEPLSAEHGGPCCLVVPHLYFWKSAKWVRAFEFLEINPSGFWEAYGYQMRGDPSAKERYADRETRAMQRMRAEARPRRK